MFSNALMSVVAFMIVCGSRKLDAIDFQPIPAFSGNFLQDVADFDSIVEPESSQNEAISVVKTRDSTNDEENVSDNIGKLSSFYEKCPRCAKKHKTVNGSKEQSSEDIDKMKRQLRQMGSFFVNDILRNEVNDDRQERDVKDIEEIEQPNRDSNGDAVSNEAIKEEKQHAENDTITAKTLLDNLENAPLREEQENPICFNLEQNKKGQVEDLNNAKTYTNSKEGSDFLEMHFYKHLPSTDAIKISPTDEKSVLINLYPEPEGKKTLRTPEKYDYIALLGKDNQLVEVPAVKFTVIPQNEDRQRRSDDFAPFFISKYSKSPRTHAKHDTFHLSCKGGICSSHWTHVPILFVNTIPELRGKLNNKHKRALDLDLSDNKYLREANLLIQNVNTSLKMGFADSKKEMPADAGVLVNSKYRNSIDNSHGKTLKRKEFKKEIYDDFASEKVGGEADNAHNYVQPEFGSLVKQENLVQSNGFGEDKDPSFVKNEIASNNDNALLQNEISPVQAVPDGAFLKNDINSWDATLNTNTAKTLKTNTVVSTYIGPKDVDSYIQNALSYIDFPLNKDLAKGETNSPKKDPSNDINSWVVQQNENAGLEQNYLNTWDVASNNDKQLSMNAVNPIQELTKIDSLVNTNSNFGSPSKDNLFQSNMDVNPSKENNLIKNIIPPADFASDKFDTIAHSKSASVDMDYNKINDLVKNAISPVLSKDDGVNKSPMRFAPNKFDSKNGINLIGPCKNCHKINPVNSGSITKSAFTSLDTPPSKYSSTFITNNDSPVQSENLVKTDHNSVDFSLSKDTNLIKNDIDSIQVASGKKESLTQNQIDPLDITSNKGSLKNQVNSRAIESNEQSPMVQKEISSDIGSNENNPEDVINSNVMNVATSGNGLSDKLVDEINPLNQGLINNGQNVLDTKVNDLSDNIIDTNSGSNSASIVENKNNDAGSNMINKEMSNDNLLDLLKNFDTLKSDSSLKVAGQNNDNNVTTLDNEAVENGHTTCELSSELPSLSTLETVKLSQEEVSFFSTSVSLTSQINNDSVELKNPSNVSLGDISQKVNNSEAHNITSNETDVYDDNEAGDILDFLGTTTINSTEQIETTTNMQTENSSNHLSISVKSIPTIVTSAVNSTPIIGSVSYEQPASKTSNVDIITTTSRSLVEKGKTAFLNKLHSLQKDLKLVFEVQNILSGSKKHESKRDKRDTMLYGRHRIKRKSKKSKHKTESTTAESKIIQKINGLGNILLWKAQQDEHSVNTRSRRFLFKSKRHKKRKKKKKKRKKKKWWKRIFGEPNSNDRHFLGRHFQNYH